MGAGVSALVQAQLLFAEDLAELILYVRLEGGGLRVKFGEVLRPAELQVLWRAQGRSWTPNSRHLLSLAADLLLFRGDQYVTDEREYRFMGDWWEARRPGNRWGVGRGYPRKDANHFERLWPPQGS